MNDSPGHVIRAGHSVPAAARPAATVVLLRGEPIEVYLLRRTATMAFAAGAYVFPGGSVDPRDTDHPVSWAGPAPADWGRVLHTDEVTARALVCAAVRETFEESGVLLAGPSATSVVHTTDTPDWEADRRALVAHELSLAEFLDRRGLVLRSDLLKAWAHWITPEAEPRRFDTRFFVAELPPGQRARPVGGEADLVAWLRPDAAVAQAVAGDLPLLPPTFHTLTEIAAFRRVGEVFACDRPITAILPVLAELEGWPYLGVSGLGQALPAVPETNPDHR